jgi:hypothetical protein
MVERARTHERVSETKVEGARFTVDGLLARPIEVYLPPGNLPDSVGLAIHFHGSAFIPIQAAAALEPAHAVAVVNLGSGSSAYERPFADSFSLPELLAALRDAATGRVGHPVAFGRLTITSFSAGYGAVRALLKDPESIALMDDIILIDGLHASYVPEQVVLADGGRIDSTQMAPFVAYAALAAAGSKTMVVVHSEIFPGTYASTTETADFLLEQIGVRRTPVLQWGPLGMQQLSEARAGRFLVKGFAGNSAPDHIDQFHAYAAWLAQSRDL